MSGRITAGERSAWLVIAIIATSAVSARAGDDGWIELSGPKALDAWKPPTGDWALAATVTVDPKNSRRLAFEPGPAPILVNGVNGKTRDIVTKQKLGDAEVHLEFLIPQGSNSGIKLEGLYEIQISDSHGIKTPLAMHCGGIYPRAELKPVYHYLDTGHAPKVNAARPPGEWQTLDIVFKAPRFDAEGKKTANARFVKVTLNGQVVQDDVELATPTGHAWHNKEIAEGPILLQGDHGPVAFRNLRARPLPVPSPSVSR
jgi:hypothetical protein